MTGTVEKCERRTQLALGRVAGINPRDERPGTQDGLTGRVGHVLAILEEMLGDAGENVLSQWVLGLWIVEKLQLICPALGIVLGRDFLIEVAPVSRIRIGIDAYAHPEIAMALSR